MPASIGFEARDPPIHRRPTRLTKRRCIAIGGIAAEQRRFWSYRRRRAAQTFYHRERMFTLLSQRNASYSCRDGDQTSALDGIDEDTPANFSRRHRHVMLTRRGRVSRRRCFYCRPRRSCRRRHGTLTDFAGHVTFTQRHAVPVSTADDDASIVSEIISPPEKLKHLARRDAHQ